MQLQKVAEQLTFDLLPLVSALPPGWTGRRSAARFLLGALFMFLSCYCSPLLAEEKVDVEHFWWGPPGPGRHLLNLKGALMGS